MSDIVITEWGRVEDRIRELEAQVAALTAERDRYWAALWQYAGPVNWQVCAPDGEEREWIGEGAGPDLAEKALAGAKKSEVATLEWLESNLTAIIRGRDARGPIVTIHAGGRQITARTIAEAVRLAAEGEAS